jgi:hypothetical protein
MGDVIDMEERRRRLADTPDASDLLITIDWDVEPPAGGPFCAIDAPPPGSAGWMLNVAQARELAVALLNWAEAPHDD